MNGGVVLVVEDNERNLKLVRDVLTYAGFVVRSARTAEDGIDMARADPPDLVLMDLQLPGMDGTQALQELRSGDRTADVPVVALTAFAMSHDRAQALDAGFDGYLVKPISVRHLPEQVDEYVRQGRTPR